MHPQAFVFVARSLIGVPLNGATVLEIGSYDVNSSLLGMSLRALCRSAAHYHGIDSRDGPGVDEVASATTYDGAAAYDLVISTETAEHMPEPQALIACAWQALKPGGRLICTAAGPGRRPHGVDGGAVGREPYGNIAPEELRAWLTDWANVEVEADTQAHDVYATAIKPNRAP